MPHPAGVSYWAKADIQGGYDVVSAGGQRPSIEEGLASVADGLNERPLAAVTHLKAVVPLSTVMGHWAYARFHSDRDILSCPP